MDDAPAARTTASSKPSARRWLGLVAIALGVSLVVVDTTIVNVITPSLIADLNINSSQAQWVQESYAIVFAAVLLLVGRLADLRGARAVFLAGVLAFAVTSAVAGLAPDAAALIAARFLQGIAGAAMLPTSLALLNQTFSGKARGQAFAVWGSTIGAASAVGPVIGGWLAENASWRWAFGINPPIAAVVAVLALRYIDRSLRRPGTVDVPSSALSVVGLAALAFGLIEGRTYGWLWSREALAIGPITWDRGVSPVVVALGLAVLALAVFVWRQKGLSTQGAPVAADGGRTEPLMDVNLFRISSFRNGNVATVLIGLGEFGIIAVLPLWLQFTLGYSALQAGTALLPLAVGSFVASGLSFTLAARMSALGLVRLGLALEVIALGGLAAVAAFTSAPWWLIAAALGLYGLGVGFATAQVTNVVLADVPGDRAGQASGIQSTARQLGSALGIAALTTVFYASIQASVTTDLRRRGFPETEAGQLARTITDSAGSVLVRWRGDASLSGVVEAGRAALSGGVAVGAVLAAAFLLIGLVATLLIPRQGVAHAAVSSHDPAGSR